MTNPMGSVHGGIAATLLDTVMGCAVQTTLDDGEAFTTTDLQVHYVRTVNPGTAVHATGTVIHRGRRLATAEGRLVDERGKLVAHATDELHDPAVARDRPDAVLTSPPSVTPRVDPWSRLRWTSWCE